MSSPSLALLDQTELLQLALTSGQRNDVSSALSYLKEAVSRPDATANAYFLLGAEYAEIGLYERAMNAMEMALKLDPALVLARMELGLLVLSSGDGERAEAVLQPLLARSDMFGLFGKGLTHLIHDQFDACLADLSAGIAMNQENAALNQDMQRIIDGVMQLPPEVRNQAKADDEESQLRHVLLSAYTGTQH